MTYKESVKYLRHVAGFGKKTPPDRIKYFLSCLGNPQEHLKFIHVAGTNGKGSVCGFLEAVLEAHNVHTGIFTSPHLLRINERIHVNGKDVSDEVFARACSQVKEVVDRAVKGGAESPSFFEILFFMALLIFREERLDVCVMETGMGGRYDATNVIVPEVSIITSISYDHMEFLGNTLGEIAAHKAGIIKDHVPVISAGQVPEVQTVLRAEAKAHGACFQCVSEDNLNFQEKHGKYIDFLNASAYDKKRNVRRNIAGDFQKENVALAIHAARLVYPEIGDGQIYQALRKVKISGRMEEIAPGIVIDVAHNVQGIEAFVKTAEKYFPGKKRILFAASHKHEEEYMKSILKKLPGIVQFDTVSIQGRRIDPYEFESVFRQMIDRSGKEEVCFVVGSFYLAGMAKELISQEEEDVRF